MKNLMLACLFIILNSMLMAQAGADRNLVLSSKQSGIVAISALTAVGDLVSLKKELNEGLNSGLTVNEIKEVLVQLYAYAGFPRSLNALNTLMVVIKERRDNGINDPAGSEAAPLPTNKTKLQLGTEMQTKLVGQSIKGAVYEFSPVIDQFLKEHLFADIFGRNNLDWKNRELVTISALAALGNVEAQLRSHFNVGLHNGLTEPQLIKLVEAIYTKIGANEGNMAEEVLQKVLGKEARIIEDQTEQNINILFSKGTKVTSKNFTGSVWLQMLVSNDTIFNANIGNVTFEPGARTNWHSHAGGQILLVTEGQGLYQEKGKAVQTIQKGSVIKCEPNIIHWHGAGPNSSLSHIAIGVNTNKGEVVWLQPVSDSDYNSNNK